MKKINKKITLFLILFSIGFLYLLSGKVEASEAAPVTDKWELLSRLESPTLNTNVRIDGDIELKNDICNYIISTDSVLDLNGHTITFNSTSNNNAGINVLFKNDNCTLTITDSVGGGTINGQAGVNSLIKISNYKDSNTFYENCNLIIDGGSYEGPTSGNNFITSDGDNIGLTINNGTFITNSDLATVFSDNSVNLTINQITVSTNLERARFNITNDRTEINKVVDSNSDIWVNGIRKYTDNLKISISSIYGCYDDINEKSGIIEIKTKSDCDETAHVETIDELNNALQTPEVKNIILKADIDSTNDLVIKINGNEKVLDLNSFCIYLDGESKIDVKYYTNHDFVMNNDIEMNGAILTNSDTSEYSIFNPTNYTNGKVNMIVNGAAVETTADIVFEDTDRFNLTINNGFFSCLEALFKFNYNYDSKITINRLNIRNYDGEDRIIKLASEKYSNDPISKILGQNSKLVRIDSENELIDQPNTTKCGEAYKGNRTLIVMPIKGLKIDKVIIAEQEYGYTEPNQADITIKNITDETIIINRIELKQDGNEENFHDDKFNLKDTMEILPGKTNLPGTLSIRPNEKKDLKPGTYHTTIIVKTIDGDEYRGEVEFKVTKIHQDLTVDISDWKYGDKAVVPKGEGNIGTAKDHFEYAKKEEEKTIEQLDFSEEFPTNAGEYIVKYIVDDTDEIYAGGFATKEFKILPKEVNVEVSGYEENYTYTGDAHKPEVTVKITDEDVTLVKDEDYTVEYGDNINAGKGTITIKSADMSNYIFDDIEEKFNITAKELQDSDVEVPEKMGYTGKTLTPNVKVTSDGKQLVEDKDYELTLKGQDGKVGEKITVTVKGKGNYVGTITKYVEIIEKMNQGLSFAQPVITKKYTDSKFIIVPTHNAGDGKITYTSSNTNVATVNKTTGEVTITGVGQTEILATACETEFYKQIGICYKLNVNKANYDTSKIKFENMSVPFDGKSHSIAAYGLPAGVKVTYTNNGKTDVGSYQVTANFSGDSKNYNPISNKIATLVINAKNISSTAVSGISDKTYTGKSITQPIVIKDGNITLKEGVDYTVSYSPNKKIGNVAITITGKGNYAGTINKTFKINPKGTSLKKLKAGKKQFKATWKKQKKETSGYEVQYSTSKNFSSGNKKVKITKNKTTSSTVKKLKAKKKYYVRIRTYKKVNGKKFYSGWSKVLSVKTK